MSLCVFLPLAAASVASAQPAAGYTYNIVAKSSGKTLDVTDGYKSAATFQDRTLVQQWDILGPTQTNQRFRLIQKTDGTYTIRAKSSGKCLQVQDGSKQNGAPIQQYQCGNPVPDYRKWTLTALTGADAGYFKVQSVNSGKVLDVKLAPNVLDPTANGVPLQQWDWLKGDNQKFEFTNKGKTVLCVDGGNDGYITQAEGWERVGLGPVDVAQNGGQIKDCLAQVANGDDLVIVAHGSQITNAKGVVTGTDFTWGANAYTGFGDGQGLAPLPPNFNKLTNVTVTLKSCFSGLAPPPPGGNPSLISKMLTAMGGNGRGNLVVGYTPEVDARTAVALTFTNNVTQQQSNQASEFVQSNRAWQGNPPVNRPGTQTTQQTALQAQLDALVGRGNVTVTIPNARTLGGPNAPAGYRNTFWDARVPALAQNAPDAQTGLGAAVDTPATACPAASSTPSCSCEQGMASVVLLPQDVTAQVLVSAASTVPLEQTITITNPGASLPGPIYLVLDELPASMLSNASGVTTADTPSGSPYIEISGNLGTSQSITVQLVFSDPQNYGIFYITRVLAGPGFMPSAPALILADDVGNYVTIDSTGTVTCDGSCSTTSPATVSPGGINWAGTLGVFTVTARGQSKPVLPPSQLRLSLSVTAATGGGSLTAQWTDVGFNGTGKTATMTVNDSFSGSGSATYTGYVDNTNAPFGTTTTVGTIGPVGSTCCATVSGAGPGGNPFSMTEVAEATMNANSTLVLEVDLTVPPQ